MIKANIFNNSITHIGNFGVNVVLDKPVVDLTITDFLFEAVSGNGTTDIELPDSLEVAYLPRTSLMIPIDLPDNVEGSFRVRMQSRQYTVDNTKLGIADNAVGLPDTEQQSLECEPKVFEYITGG